MTSFGQRWIEQLVERYNALGPSAMGDLRRGNGAAAKVLTPELLERLRLRLAEPPPDGGVWTSGKVARWMAGELGRASLAPQRGWEALRAIGWSMQKPRPRNPKAATPELRLFAEEAGAGRERRIVLVLDNAGWHGEAGLAVPGGVRLVFQPAYTPEVQPAESSDLIGAAFPARGDRSPSRRAI